MNSCISPLTMWSSMKSPHSSSNKKLDRKPSSVPYVNSSDKFNTKPIQKKPESAGAIVNLRVPSGQQYTTPSLTSTTILKNKTFNKTLRKHTQDGNLTTIPEIPLNNNNNKGDLGKRPKSKKKWKHQTISKSVIKQEFGDQHERGENVLKKYKMNFQKVASDFNVAKVFDDNFEDNEDVDVEDLLYSLEPWSLEELEEITRKYSEISCEERKSTKTKTGKQKNVTQKKKSKNNDMHNVASSLSFPMKNIKKSRIPVSPDSSGFDTDFDTDELFLSLSNYDCEWSLSESDISSEEIESETSIKVTHTSETERNRPYVPPATEKYYQAKLAKLHLIELGIKV